MNDFPTLTDAFTELERQADEATSRHSGLSLPVTARHRSRVPLMAASIVGVLAVVTGATLLSGRDGAGSGSQAGGPPMTSTARTSSAPAAFHIPQTAADLARRFRVVLGDTATFTVTDTGRAGDATAPIPTKSSVRHEGGPAQPVRASSAPARPNGAAIVGALTASGVTGGYDLQIFRTDVGTKAGCDDPDRSRCTVSRLADGSSLAVGREALPGAANAVTYQVNLIRPDGVEFLMHVSNEADPKGASKVLAPQPPLATKQMTALVTSDRW